tara:strand:- start:449 stop:1102 length:654 start_codon:yes stop_codon:yes gene_type:complete
MNSTDALRLLTLNFLESCSVYLDEDTYDSVKLIVEQTPSNKLLKKVKKFMTPFNNILENDTLTKKDLLQTGFLKVDAEIPDDEVEKLATQARLCMMLVKTLSEIDEETLTQIETLAQSLQVGLQDEFDKLPEEQKTNDPSDVLKCLFNNLNEAKGEGDLPLPLLDTAAQNSGMGDVLNKIVPNVMSALAQSEHGSEEERKRKLLKMYENIDGNTKPR